MIFFDINIFLCRNVFLTSFFSCLFCIISACFPSFCFLLLFFVIVNFSFLGRYFLDFLPSAIFLFFSKSSYFVFYFWTFSFWRVFVFFSCFYRFFPLFLLFFSFFLFFRCVQLFFKKNVNLSSLFSRRKKCVCQFPLWEPFSKNVSFLNVFETLFFRVSSLFFVVCSKKSWHNFFFSLPLLQRILIFHFLCSPSVYFWMFFLITRAFKKKPRNVFLCPFHKLKTFRWKKKALSSFRKNCVFILSFCIRFWG